VSIAGQVQKLQYAGAVISSTVVASVRRPSFNSVAGLMVKLRRRYDIAFISLNNFGNRHYCSLHNDGTVKGVVHFNLNATMRANRISILYTSIV